jgi:hypothetical protein
MSKEDVSDEIKNVSKMFFVFRGELIAANGGVFAGWFWCEGTSRNPSLPCIGPFETEKAAAEYAEKHGGMVQ